MKQGLLSVWRAVTWPWRRFPKTVFGLTGLVAVLCLIVVGSNAYILLTIAPQVRVKICEHFRLTIHDLHNDVDPVMFDNQVRALARRQGNRVSIDGLP